MEQKIKAYTLMEVTVAMLLSAICVTICYTAYGLITDYDRAFQQQNEQTGELMALTQVMEKDFINSSYCFKNDEGLFLVQDSAAVQYSFTPEYITRSLNELHTDTFKLQPTLPKYYFENEMVLGADTIDQINFEVVLAKRGVLPFQLIKHYSAANLFH